MQEFEDVRVAAGALIICLIILLLIRWNDHKATRARKKAGQRQRLERRFEELQVIGPDGRPTSARDVTVEAGSQAFIQVDELKRPPASVTAVVNPAGPPPSMPTPQQPIIVPDVTPPHPPPVDYPEFEPPDMFLDPPPSVFTQPDKLVAALEYGPATTRQLSERTGLDWVEVTRQLQPLLLSRQVVVLPSNSSVADLWALPDRRV